MGSSLSTTRKASLQHLGVVADVILLLSCELLEVLRKHRSLGSGAFIAAATITVNNRNGSGLIWVHYVNYGPCSSGLIRVNRLFFIEFDRHQRKFKERHQECDTYDLAARLIKQSSHQRDYTYRSLHMPRILGKKKQDMIRIEKAWRGTCGKSTLERSVTGFVRKDSWQAVPSCSIDFSPTTHFEISSMKDSASDLFILFHLDKDPDWMSKHAKNCKSDPGQRCQYYVYIILYYIILYILYNIIESNYLTGLGSPSVKRWRVFQVPGTSRTSISEFQSCRKANSALRSSRTFLGLEWGQDAPGISKKAKDPGTTNEKHLAKSITPRCRCH